MKRHIQTEHVRAHELSDQQVKCFSTAVGMSDGYVAKPGDWITYREHYTGSDLTGTRCGRMLGRVEAPDASSSRFDIPAVKGHLSILALSDDCCYAYIRWVAPEDVLGIRKQPPAAFLAFMTGPLPDPDLVHKLENYGTLSQSYIDKVPHHINAWRHGMSPAAWDATHRKEDSDVQTPQAEI